MIRIESIRQEGTESTGALLFVDLLDEAKQQTCWELDIKTGKPIAGTLCLEDEETVIPLNREPDHREFFALRRAFNQFQRRGPTRPN